MKSSTLDEFAYVIVNGLESVFVVNHGLLWKVFVNPAL